MKEKVQEVLEVKISVRDIQAGSVCNEEVEKQLREMGKTFARMKWSTAKLECNLRFVIACLAHQSIPSSGSLAHSPTQHLIFCWNEQQWEFTHVNGGK